MRQERTKIVFVLILAFVLCAVISSKLLGKETVELAKARQQTEKLATRVSELSAVSRPLRLSDADLSVFESALPNSARIDPLVNCLVDSLEQQNVTSHGWEVTTSDQGPDVSMIHIAFGFECDLALLPELLSEIRNNQRLVLIDNLTLSAATEPSDEMISVSLRLCAFYLNTDHQRISGVTP